MNQNNIHPMNGIEGSKPEGVKAAVKKPAGEDLSRWENEGGQPQPLPNLNLDSKDKDFFQRTLERVFQGGQANIEHLRVRVEQHVRERPLAAVGIAAALGFMIAGGFSTRAGRKILKSVAQYGMEHYAALR